MRRIGLLSISALALSLAVTPVLAQNTKIGVTAVVNPDATGQAPSQTRRTLLVGADVFANENVITTEKGQAQMLFLDESALTIGPNSEVVLDEFVYDPNTKTGTIALSATKGLFRLVGGRISKTNPVTLKTPTATIGIRGGIAMVNAAEGGGTSSTFLFGDQMDVTSGGVTKSATRPGFTITATDPNVPPSDPVPTSSDVLSGALSSLEGSSEPAGDGENTPTDDAVAASGVSGGSEADPGAIAPTDGADTGGALAANSGVTDDAEGTAEKNETSQETAGDTVSGGVSLSGLNGRYRHASNGLTAGVDTSGSSLDIPFSGASVTNNVFTTSLVSGSTTSTLTVPVQEASLGSLSFTNASGSTTGSAPFGPLTGTSTIFSGNQFLVIEAIEDNLPSHRFLAFAGTATTTFPTTGATFYQHRRDFVMDSNVPFFLKASGGDILADPALSTAPNSFAAIYWDTSASSSAQRAFGFAVGGVSGSGTSQTSVGSLLIGKVLTATSDGVTRTFILGEARGSSRTSSSLAPHIINGDASTAFGGGSSINQDIYFFGDNAGHFVMQGVQVNSSGIEINQSTQKVTDTFTTVAAATKYVPNTVFSPNTTDTLGTRTTREMAGYTGGLIEEFNSAGMAVSSGTTLFWTLGTLVSGSSNPVPTNVDVDTNASTNKVHVHFNGENPQTPATNAGVTLFSAHLGDTQDNTTSGFSAFIDNANFGAFDTPLANSVQSIKMMTPTEVDHGMATVNSSGAANFGISSPCTCSFLDWGVWSANFIQSSIQQDRIHLAGWVSGELAALTSGVLTNKPTGTATYTGHMYGTVQTVISSVTHMYQASGTYTNAWNYDSNSGTVTLSSFDNLPNITGTATAISPSNREFAAFSMSGGSFAAQVRGSFVKNPAVNTAAGNVAGQIGDFHILGPDYKAAGIFAAQTP